MYRGGVYVFFHGNSDCCVRVIPEGIPIYRRLAQSANTLTSAALSENWWAYFKKQKHVMFSLGVQPKSSAISSHSKRFPPAHCLNIAFPRTNKRAQASDLHSIALTVLSQRSIRRRSIVLIIALEIVLAALQPRRITNWRDWKGGDLPFRFILLMRIIIKIRPILSQISY